MAINLKKNDGVLSPPPDDINPKTGEMFWFIKDYKICAKSYEEALEILSLIENN
jgi:hypothetical protein